MPIRIVSNDYTQHAIIHRRSKNIPKLSPFAPWPGAVINPEWFELSMSNTNFYGPKDVRASDVRQDVISKSEAFSEILWDSHTSTYQICWIEETNPPTAFHKWIFTNEYISSPKRDILKILWKREIAPFLFYNILLHYVRFPRKNRDQIFTSR